MKLTQANFYKYVFIFQAACVIALLIAITASSSWSVDGVPFFQRGVIAWLIVSVLLTVVLYTKMITPNDYPLRLILRVLTFGIYYYLVLTYAQNVSVALIVAVGVMLYLPMPFMFIITTASAINLITFYLTIEFVITSDASGIFRHLAGAYFTVVSIVATIAFGYVLAVLFYYIIQGPDKKVAYRSNYGFVAGIGTNVLSASYLIVIAFITSIYKVINRTLTMYARYLNLNHELVGKGYVHYLESHYFVEFKNIVNAGIKGSISSFFVNLGEFNKNKDGHSSRMVRIFMGIYMFFQALFVCVIGIVVAAIVIALHFVIINIVRAIYMVVKKVRVVTEQNFRKKNGVRVVCDVCYHIDELPHYECPECFEKHDIRPGEYGIFKYRCACGATLPNTFKDERYALTAYCKACDAEYEHLESAPIITPVIGDKFIGKTTSIANSFKGMLQETQHSPIKASFLSGGKLVQFNGLVNSPILPTVTTNPEPYTVHFTGRAGKPNISLHAYDVTGDAFNSLEDIRRLKYLSLADGYVFLLDGKNLADEFSEIGDTLERLIMYWQTESKEKSENKFTTPIAFMFNQMDLANLPEVNSTTVKNWLIQNGFADLVRKIDMTFETYELFCANSTTASGTQSPAQAYEWIVNQKSDLKLGGLSK